MKTPPRPLRVLQVIVGAMTAGAAFFLAIVLTIGPMVKPPPAPLPPTLFTLIAAAFVGVGLIARAVVLGSVIAKGRREIVAGAHAPADPRRRMNLPPSDVADKPLDPCRDEKRLLLVFQGKTIVSVAMFEGWGFFATIAYMIEGNPLSLGLAVVLMLCVAAHFPTRSRTIAWVERQMEIVEHEKALR